MTLAAVRAVAAKYPDLHIMHFDAHADLRDDYLGARLSHACVLRRCHDLLGDGRIHQFCIRSGEREEFRFAAQHTDFHPLSFDGLEETVRELKEKNVPIYFTIDLDCLDPAVFPGTGTPEAGGVTFLELLEAIRTVAQANVVGADVNELAPMLDASGVLYAYQELADLPAGYSIPEGRVKPWGTAHAILVAEEAIGDAPFAVINADDYYGPQGFKLIYDYLSTHADGDRYAWAMVGFLLGNTVSANGSVSRGVCVTDESRNLVSVTERTCIEPYADGIHYSEDGGKSWADLPADCVVSMNLWGFTPAYVQEAKAGFAAFLQASLPVNPMKCEYYLPTVVTNALEAGKADVHVLTSADKWHGITYREDKPELVEALKKMSEDGLYPVDRLF